MNGIFKFNLILVIAVSVYYIRIGLTQPTTTNPPRQSKYNGKNSSSGKSTRSPMCKLNAKCSYRISKLVENEYLTIKNIMDNLMNSHWNITLDYVNMYLDQNLKACDQYIENIGVNQVISRDFRHPNALFKSVSNNLTNKTIKDQYEIEWYEKYKLIKPKLQSKNYYNICNSIGLKLHYLMYQYPEKGTATGKCNLGKNDESLVTILIDFYISQTFMKNCYGNVELLAISIRKLLKYDCERAHSFKIAYFTSKYINLFRTCDPYLTVNDLIYDDSVSKCTNTFLNGTINKKYCSWFEIVCKHPSKCFKITNDKSENSTSDTVD